MSGSGDGDDKIETVSRLGDGDGEAMDVSSSEQITKDVKIDEEFIEDIPDNEIKDNSSDVKETIKMEEVEKKLDNNNIEGSIESASEIITDSVETSNKDVLVDLGDNDGKIDDDSVEKNDEDKAEGNNESKKSDEENSEDDNSVAEETCTSTKNQKVSTMNMPKGSSTFRMHLTKEEIDQMLNDGTLEKVSEGHYRVRPESVKSLKSTPLALAKNLDLEDNSSSDILDTNFLSDNAVSSPETCTNIQTNSETPPVTQVTSLPVVQQAPLIALMPVNQVSANNTNNAFIALPVQQNSTATGYNQNLPSFVAVSQSSRSSQISATPSLQKSSAADVKVVYSSTLEQPESSISTSQSTISHTNSSVLDELPTFSTKSSGLKRKPIFDTTKVKRPYKFAKLTDKPKKRNSHRNIVSDINSSDEEGDGGLAKCKAYGAELASMFFQKIGEPKTTNKSLLDKLHKSIFNDDNLDSDQESDDGSLTEEVIEKVKSGKGNYNVVNCPGSQKYEAFIGPENNSKISISRCQEMRNTKSASYEVYKVKVTSAGREANTNILIPLPEGYKLSFPSKPKEEPVEFSHIPHEDSESLNNVHPLFLEKLAKTELKLRKYKDQIKVLRTRYLELLQEYANRPQFSTVADLVGSSAKFLTEDQLVFFLMQLKAGAHNMQGIRYSVREKILALSIYQKSPEVYKWFCKLFNLPSKRVLDLWLEEVGSQDPKLLKKLMYYIYVTYNFKPNTDD